LQHRYRGLQRTMMEWASYPRRLRSLSACHAGCTDRVLFGWHAGGARQLGSRSLVPFGGRLGRACRYRSPITHQRLPPIRAWKCQSGSMIAVLMRSWASGGVARTFQGASCQYAPCRVSIPEPV